MKQQQHSLMKFDPAYRKEKPYPSHADQWREYHGNAAWIFNPWTGDPRAPADIGRDPYGHLIVPPNEPVFASKENTEREELKKLAGELNRFRARIEGVLWPNCGMAD